MSQLQPVALLAAGVLLSTCLRGIDLPDTLVDLLADESPPIESLGAFLVSPDGSHVIFDGIRVGDDSSSLFSIPTVGGTASRLGPDPGVFSGLRASITSDSQLVVFRATDNNAGIDGLFAAPIEGPDSAAVNLLGCIPVELRYWDFELLPDSVRLLIVASNAAGSRELLLVPLSGCPHGAVRINHKLHQGEGVWSWTVAPDSSELSYSTTFPPSPQAHLFITSLKHVKPVAITPDLPAGAYGGWPCVFSTDGTVCVFLADLETSQKLELFEVRQPWKRSSPVRISADLPSGSSVATDARIAQANRIALYRAVLIDPGGIEQGSALYSVPIDGQASDAQKISENDAGLSTSASLAAISSNGELVAYRLLDTNYDSSRILAVPIRGPSSAAIPISPTYGLEALLSRYPYERYGAAGIVYASKVDDQLVCHSTALDGSIGTGIALFQQPLALADVDGTTCGVRPRQDGVLEVTQEPSTAYASVPPVVLRLSHLLPPADSQLFELLDPALFQQYNGIRSYRFTPDGEFVILLGRQPNEPTTLFRLKLPLFWETFESGTTLHWSITSAGD